MLVIRRILILVVAVLGTVPMQAQTMRQMWMDMPDEMVPYLNRSNRTELADYVEMKVDAAIRNKLEDTTCIEMLTPEYVRVRLNASHRLEMKLLNRGDGSKVLCVVNTYLGPAADSRLSFYDTEWHRIYDIQVPDAASLVLKHRPEGMGLERYSELLSMLVPLLVEMCLSETDDTITMFLSIPMISRDDMDEIKSVLCQQVLRWDGTSFSIQ